MKKILLLIIFAIYLVSCEQGNQQKETPNYSKMDLFVKRFKANNSKMWMNDITKQEGNDKFQKEVFSYFVDSSGISSIPLYVRSINKLGKGYVIHLENNTTFGKNDISQFSHIDIFALTPDSIARNLIQGDTVEYNITKYKKVNILTDAMRSLVTTDRVWNNIVELASPNDNVSPDDSYGNYILEAEGFKKKF
jgi:hypothetical protein